MYRIALNVAISFYRRESVWAWHVVPGSEHLLEAIDESGNRSEEIQILYRWIEELDPFSKALVILYLDGNKLPGDC
jgi:DNA-directed RNA polymerase specialized sigma24 family protein